MTDIDFYQYETIEECKKDILENCVLPYRTDEDVNGDEWTLSAQDEMMSIFNEYMKTATDVYFLVDKKRFHVLSTNIEKNSDDYELFTSNIQCDDDVTVKKLLSILQFYVDQGVKVKRFDRELFVSQIEKRSYLYLALCQGTVVTWIHRMRKLIQ
jgi:hypothetical protein